MKKTVIIFCVQSNQKVANLSRLEISLFKDNKGDEAMAQSTRFYYYLYQINCLGYL